MKIIVMGGAGDVGSRCVEDLASTPGVERVTIADANAEVADRVAQSCAGAQAAVDVKIVDANDHGALVDAMKGYDAAASALGPFHRFEAKLVAAAVDAGTCYASVCDEWNAAQEVMDKYGQAARDKGVLVLSGLGTSPGFTNVGIRFLCDQLDEPTEASIYVFQPLNAGGGPAVFKHMFFIMSGKVAVWRDGRLEMIKACSEKRTVEFPEFGRIKVWNMGHAEPVTVPKFIPELKSVNFFMGYGKGAELFVYPSQLNLFDTPKKVDNAVKFVWKIEELANKLFPDQDPAHGAVRVDVWGKKDGKTVRKTLCGLGQMREATGLSLSVGTQMLIKGELRIDKSQGGVFAPEGCLDPRKFIVYMKEKGLQGYEDIAMTKPVE